MPICPYDVLLQRARVGNYAVGAFNVFAMEFLPTILEAAEEEQAPILLQIAPIHFYLMDVPHYVQYVKSQIVKCTVPVGLHLDHGKSEEIILKGIQAGFPSVMFDGSRFSFEENVRRTRQVVEMCHQVGVTVEAELGTLNDEAVEWNTENRQKWMTDPQAAGQFVRETGVDALAVSIGNAHGIYKGTPKLDFPRLRAIRDAVPVPLVLHGGSGLSEDDFRKAILCGINKINIYTDMSVAASQQAKAILIASELPVDYPTILFQARQAVKQVVREKIRIFNRTLSSPPGTRK